MDVRCEKCQTEYELDEARLKPGGVTVKCTNCGHMFKIRKRTNTNVGAPVPDAARAKPPSKPAGAMPAQAQQTAAGPGYTGRPDSLLDDGPTTPQDGPTTVDRQWLIRLENGEQFGSGDGVGQLLEAVEGEVGIGGVQGRQRGGGEQGAVGHDGVQQLEVGGAAARVGEAEIRDAAAEFFAPERQLVLLLNDHRAHQISPATIAALVRLEKSLELAVLQHTSPLIGYDPAFRTLSTETHSHAKSCLATYIPAFLSCRISGAIPPPIAIHSRASRLR